MISEWFDTFPSSRCQYLRYEGSDHRPLLTFLDTRRKKGAKIFRFDRRLKDNPEVRKLVQETWNSVPYLDVEAKLSCCRKAICSWSRAFHENSRKALKALRSQLDAAMTNQVPQDDLIHEINTNLLKAYKAEDDYWRQRSRQLWLTLGNSNTGYFHASTKARKAKNRLTVIEDENGIPWFEEEQIAGVICKYFDHIFTSEHHDGLQTVEKALQHCVTDEMNEALIKAPSDIEIKEATFAIHPDKAPDPDGFSASFFHANWEVVGSDVIREIKAFFATETLRTSQNVTHVRLIPKIVGAKRVADYRPIALCNVYFKIISKLHTQT